MFGEKPVKKGEIEKPFSLLFRHIYGLISVRALCLICLVSPNKIDSTAHIAHKYDTGPSTQTHNVPLRIGYAST